MSSMANASFKVCVKLVAVLVTFPVILSTGIISKGAVFYTTSQIGREITKLASEGQIQFRKLNKVTQSLELPVRIRFSTTSDRHRLLAVGPVLQFRRPRVISINSLVTLLFFSPSIVETPPVRAIFNRLWTGIGTDRWDGLACRFRLAISLGVRPTAASRIRMY